MARTKGNRKRSPNSNGIIRQILIFVICVAMMLLGKADITAFNSVRTALTGFVTPIADVVSVPFRAVYAMVDSMQAVANLREENLRLKKDVERLSQWRRKAEILQNENRQLRSVSGVIIPEGTTPVAARVIAVNADSFAHSVLINVGANAGIQKGNAVTTTDGLVGIIVSIGAKHSQVLLITDINAMIPVILSSSSWPATTAGLNSTELDLRFLPAEATANLDDLVQTSGHGGVLPAGIPVGRITEVSADTIKVWPVADLQRLGFVSVLTTKEDPGFAIDDIYDQTFRTLPQDEEGFTLEGINALGQRSQGDEIPINGEER